MICYREAQEIIVAQAQRLPSESIRSPHALGRVLAETVTSPINLPSFDNTAMDGYAIASGGVQVPAGSAWDVLGEQAAGDGVSQATAGCWEIMTGARIPDGYDAVIPVEQVRITQLRPDGRPARIECTDIVFPGQHVRRTGEDIARGDIAMQAGDRLAAQHVMLLAGLGISHVPAIREPRVALICTGRELVDDLDQALIEGQIRNSNGPFLAARLAAAGARVIHVETVSDEPQAFIAALNRSLALAPDIVVSTGAVSMGRYDFVPDTLQRENAKILFHKVAIRPGKPLLFARLATGPLYFGLPGNPVSSAVGLRFFVETAIRAMTGLMSERALLVPIKTAIKKKPGFRFHQKAGLQVDENGRLFAEVLSGQESFRIRPMLQSNAWVVLPEEAENISAESLVEVYGLGHLEFPFMRALSP